MRIFCETDVLHPCRTAPNSQRRDGLGARDLRDEITRPEADMYTSSRLYLSLLPASRLSATPDVRGFAFFCGVLFELKIASLPGWLERLLCSHLCTESLLKVLRQIASPSRLLERMAVEEFLLQMLRMCSCQHKGQLNSAEGDHPAHRMEAPGGLILPAPPAQVSRRESRLAMLQHCRTETSAPRCVRTEDSEIAELDA